MKNNGKEFELEELVFKVFMKHIKANKLYMAFRWSVNHDRANRDLIHVLSSTLCGDKYIHSKDRILRIGAAFISAHSVNDILRIMNAERGKQKVENTAQFQISIMNMVNMLIHSCIEHAITSDMNILEKMGSAVFEEVGKTLFGNDFKDMTEEAIDPRHREFMEKMGQLNGERAGFPQEPPSNEFLRAMRDRMRRVMERRRDNEERRYNARPMIYNPFDFEDTWADTF